MDYDNKALSWDSEKRINRAKIIAEEILKRIEIKESFNALEFGCGTGLISFNLYKSFKEITLVDTSKGMIDVLNSKIEKNNIKNMTAYQLDINDQQIIEEKYDVIYTSMVLHHIKDTKRVLMSLINLLNKNGYLCIIDLDEEDGSFHSNEKDFDGHNGFNQESLIGILRRLGINDVNSSNFYSDKKGIEGREIDYKLFIMIGKK